VQERLVLEGETPCQGCVFELPRAASKARNAVARSNLLHTEGNVNMKAQGETSKTLLTPGFLPRNWPV
jgi:hypothetical protein